MFLVASYTSGLCVLPQADGSLQAFVPNLPWTAWDSLFWPPIAGHRLLPAAVRQLARHGFLHMIISKTPASQHGAGGQKYSCSSFGKCLLAVTSHVSAVPVLTVSCELMTACARSSLHLVLPWLAPNGLFRACRARWVSGRGLGAPAKGGTRLGPSKAAVAAEQTIWKC